MSTFVNKEPVEKSDKNSEELNVSKMLRHFSSLLIRFFKCHVISREFDDFRSAFGHQRQVAVSSVNLYREENNGWKKEGWKEDLSGEEWNRFRDHRS